MSKNFELLRRVEDRVWVPAESGPVAQHRVRRPSNRSSADEQPDWVRILSVLRRHWRWSVTFAGAVTAAVALFTWMMAPVYQPTARIEVDPRGAETFSLESGASNSDPSQYLETQAQELRSDELAMAVIRKLHLDRQHVSGSFPAGGPAQPASQPDIASAPPEETTALRSFRNHLKVSRDSTSHLISVSFAAHDPRLAAEVTNTLVDTFINNSYQTRHAAILNSTEWLSKQLDDIRSRVNESNRALAEFQSATGIASIDDSQSTFSERITELNRQMAQAQSDRIQYEAFIRRLQAAGDSELPQLSNDQVLQELNKKLSETQTQLSGALAIYGRRNPIVIKLEDEVSELKQQIVIQRKRVFDNLRTAYTAAVIRERLLDTQIARATKEVSQLARYNALKKDVQANTDVYNLLFTKVKEAGIAAESTTSNIRVIDRARVLQDPSRPQWLVNMIAALGAGLTGGLALAFVREGMDKKVRTVYDVRECTGLSAISVVPVIGATKGIFRSEHALDIAHTFLLDRPTSPESEALLGLCTTLRLSWRDRPPRVLLIASPFTGDGKTTLAVNLAIAVARRGRTCLMDGDLRKAGIGQVFGLSSERGLHDAIAGSASLDDVLVPVPNAENLTVLPAGSGPTHPSDLLCSENIGTVLSRLRERFEYIVVDSPPLLPFADARALAPLADGIVLVGRAGSTTRDALMRSIELLAEVNSAPVIGVVLNAAVVGVAPYYSYT